MSSCSGNCSSCSSSDCGDRKKENLLASLNPKSTVKKVQQIKVTVNEKPQEE